MSMSTTVHGINNHEGGEPMQWPKRVHDMLGRDPQVGDWHAECCSLDFKQIDSVEMLSELLGHYDEIDSGGDFWKTEQEGRAALAHRTADCGAMPASDPRFDR